MKRSSAPATEIDEQLVGVHGGTGATEHGLFLFCLPRELHCPVIPDELFIKPEYRNGP